MPTDRLAWETDCAGMVNSRQGGVSKASDAEVVSAYREHGSVWRAADALGMCGQSVHERLRRIGVDTSMNVFTAADEAVLRAEYAKHADAGTLQKLAESMGRTKQFICRKAGMLGLTNASRKKPYLAAVTSKNFKRWHVENAHPRGALGLRHTPETRGRISAAARAFWASLSEEERAELTMKQMKARVDGGGSIAGRHKRGSWRAGWREIGGVKKYYRSRWEANYARYLQWLKDRGEIKDWAHEPETFWFDGIKRGVRSYLPDFRVWENDGASKLHEVKGWMDSRSKTTLRRMKKYHPNETVIVIDRRQYEAIERKMAAMIVDWEEKL